MEPLAGWADNGLIGLRRILLSAFYRNGAFRNIPGLPPEIQS
jgi:hypothetical protein